MKKMIIVYYLMVIMTFSVTVFLTAESKDFNAGSIYMIGEEEGSSVMESKEIDGDYFWGGFRMDFSGKADDLYLLGRYIDFEGESDGSVTIFGDTIKIDGLVGNNLHSAGNDLRISGTVSDTAFLAGQDITIADSAVVEGTLFSGSNTLHILGQLNNGLLAGAGEIIIDGPVKGNVNVRTGKLIITERGSIDGNLTYGANSIITKEEEGRISGNVLFVENKEKDKDSFSKFRFVASLIFTIGLVITGLLFLLLPISRKIFSREREFKSCGKTALWGLIPLFIYPIAIVFTIPLFPLSLALFLGGFPLWLLTTIMGLTIAGDLMFKAFGWQKDNRYLNFLLAFAAYTILLLVPYLGFLVGLAVTALGAGQMIRSTFQTQW